jgi:hypothetical protein
MLDRRVVPYPASAGLANSPSAYSTRLSISKAELLFEAPPLVERLDFAFFFVFSLTLPMPTHHDFSFSDLRA